MLCARLNHLSTNSLWDFCSDFSVSLLSSRLFLVGDTEMWTLSPWQAAFQQVFHFDDYIVTEPNVSKLIPM